VAFYLGCVLLCLYGYMDKRLFLIIIFLITLFFPGSLSAAKKEAPKVKEPLILSVPFTSQAPLAEWKDERQQDGCEEASALMARAWQLGSDTKTKNEWRRQILALSDYELKHYGEFRDLSLEAVRDWVFGDYFSDKSVSIKKATSSASILAELEKGKLILIQADGRALKNPYFTAPGPERHMLLIKGYDYSKKQFVVNDPGTRRGESYRYPEKVLYAAIRPYATGDKEAFPPLEKKYLSIEKPLKK